MLTRDKNYWNSERSCRPSASDGAMRSIGERYTKKSLKSGDAFWTFPPNGTAISGYVTLAYVYVVCCTRWNISLLTCGSLWNIWTSATNYHQATSVYYAPTSLRMEHYEMTTDVCLSVRLSVACLDLTWQRKGLQRKPNTGTMEAHHYLEVKRLKIKITRSINAVS